MSCQNRFYIWGCFRFACTDFLEPGTFCCASLSGSPFFSDLRPWLSSPSFSAGPPSRRSTPWAGARAYLRAFMPSSYIITSVLRIAWMLHSTRWCGPLLTVVRAGWRKQEDEEGLSPRGDSGQASPSGPPSIGRGGWERRLSLGGDGRRAGARGELAGGGARGAQRRSHDGRQGVDEE